MPRGEIGRHKELKSKDCGLNLKYLIKSLK